MTARVRVSFERPADEPGRGYEVRIGSGVLHGLADALAEVCPAHRYVVIADSRVADLYGAAVLRAVRKSGRPADLFTFPEGEANKNRDSWASLSDQMLQAGVGRDAAVLALGGGVTGDLAGFVAATYLRGLPLIQLPTTLLAMIDSSVGGKTGVDTPAGKNLIGAFLQPQQVIADTDTLKTLPPEQVRSGLAEAVKHGAIADAAYFGWISSRGEDLLALESDTVAELIRRSVQIKAEVVGEDEKEGGRRKILNFGHTIGHAIEAESKFELLHGESIAIGMVVEARIGERIGSTTAGTADELGRVFSSLGLPVRVPEAMSPDRVLELTRADKKARGGRVEYALIERIGSASRGTGSFGTPVDDEVVVGVIRDQSS